MSCFLHFLLLLCGYKEEWLYVYIHYLPVRSFKLKCDISASVSARNYCTATVKVVWLETLNPSLFSRGNSTDH